MSDQPFAVQASAGTCQSSYTHDEWAARTVHTGHAVKVSKHVQERSQGAIELLCIHSWKTGKAEGWEGG